MQGPQANKFSLMGAQSALAIALSPSECVRKLLMRNATGLGDRAATCSALRITDPHTVLCSNCLEQAVAIDAAVKASKQRQIASTDAFMNVQRALDDDKCPMCGGEGYGCIVGATNSTEPCRMAVLRLREPNTTQSCGRCLSGLHDVTKCPLIGKNKLLPRGLCW